MKWINSCIAKRSVVRCTSVSLSFGYLCIFVQKKNRLLLFFTNILFFFFRICFRSSSYALLTLPCHQTHACTQTIQTVKQLESLLSSFCSFLRSSLSLSSFRSFLNRHVCLLLINPCVQSYLRIKLSLSFSVSPSLPSTTQCLVCLSSCYNLSLNSILSPLFAIKINRHSPLYIFPPKWRTSIEKKKKVFAYITASVSWTGNLLRYWKLIVPYSWVLKFRFFFFCKKIP